MIKRLLTTLAICATLSIPATASWEKVLGDLSRGNPPPRITISDHYGGSLSDHISKYSMLRDSGAYIRIADVCLSACTFVLAFLPVERICAEPQAVFGFHSAHMNGPFGPVFAKEGTRLGWNLYPKWLQDKLKEKGWDGDGDKEHPDMVYFRATELVDDCNR
jgi:hypothetical protein